MEQEVVLRNAHGTALSMKTKCESWITECLYAATNPRRCFQDCHFEPGFLQFVSGTQPRDASSDNGDLNIFSLVGTGQKFSRLTVGFPETSPGPSFISLRSSYFNCSLSSGRGGSCFPTPAVTSWKTEAISSAVSSALAKRRKFRRGRVLSERVSYCSQLAAGTLDAMSYLFFVRGACQLLEMEGVEE